jgi:hypothetical protein
MASTFLRPLYRPQSLGLGFGLSLATFHLSQQNPMRLDSGFPIGATNSYHREVETPVLKNGRLNPRAIRHISSGSITGSSKSFLTIMLRTERLIYIVQLGLCAGLAVGTFSRSLVLIIGLLVVGVQVRICNHSMT